jgi:hypothetical protein
MVSICTKGRAVELLTHAQTKDSTDNESIQLKVQALHALKKILRPYEMGIRTYSKGQF